MKSNAQPSITYVYTVSHSKNASEGIANGPVPGYFPCACGWLRKNMYYVDQEESWYICKIEQKYTATLKEPPADREALRRARIFCADAPANDESILRFHRDRKWLCTE